MPFLAPLVGSALRPIGKDPKVRRLAPYVAILGLAFATALAAAAIVRRFGFI
jgi:hypothetical protein